MICSTCNNDKAESEFSFRSKADGGRHSKCKSCVAEYAKLHYQANKEAYKFRARVTTKKSREENRRFIIEYLKKNPCVDCGNPDIRVLQFDHRISLKNRNGRRVSQMVSSLPRLIKEIESCDVRCANCHMIKTFSECGWKARLPM